MIPQRAIKKPAIRWQKTYLSKHPWMKHLQWARTRARRKGIECVLTPEQIKLLWLNSAASLLKRPSIDRRDGTKGYSFANYRFIEHAENSRLGNLRRPTTARQRETARKNLSGWRAKQKAA